MGYEWADQKKVLSPADRRAAAAHLIEEEGCSVSRASKLDATSHSTYQHIKKVKDDQAVEDALLL